MLRAILAQEKAGYGPLATLQDVDEAILRGRSYTTEDTRHLVTLDELESILGGTPKENVLEIHRKKSPLGGFEFLDHWRKRSMKILSNDAAVRATFDHLTEGILQDLDWSNVVVVGGMVLQTLMATDSSRDDEPEVLESDVDLYVYGLNAEEANAKFQHIYDVWIRNLPNIARGTPGEKGDVRQAGNATAKAKVKAKK